MKTNLTNLLLLAVLFAASLFADPVKLKFQPLAELNGALQSLDGSERAYENVSLPNGQTGTRVLRVPFDLKAAVRIGIARDISAVKFALESFEAKRQIILLQVSPGAPEKIQNDPALLAKFMTAWTEATKDPITVDLFLLTEEDLNLDKNKDLANATIAGLAPIIKPK